MNQPAKRFVRMFQPRFADLVRLGQKTQTVRKTPKRMPKVGDIIDARAWIGAPYRSKKVKLAEGTIMRVERVVIGREFISVGGSFLWPLERIKFAESDGFKDFPELLDWFAETHDLPFTGILIQWTLNA